MEFLWVVNGEEVVGIDGGEALFPHAPRCCLAAEDDECLQTFDVEVCLYAWVGGGGANKLLESWAWVVHV